MFDAWTVKEECVQWIRDFFEENGQGCNAVIGISGGKDSSTVAALCVEALGRNRVIGVLMPNGIQHDIDAAESLVEHLGIRSVTVNIAAAVTGLKRSIPFELSEQARINLPARIRMAALYAVSQSNNGRPCSNLTVQEVKAVGRVLGLPEELIEKTPIDGLSGKTDEDNLGFLYEELDRYIRTGEIDDLQKKEKIDRLHRLNLFKLNLMPAFDPHLHIGIPETAEE